MAQHHLAIENAKDLAREQIKKIGEDKDFTIHIEGVKETIECNSLLLKITSGWFDDYFSYNDAKNSVILPADKNINIIRKIVDYIHGQQLFIAYKQLIPMIKEEFYFRVSHLSTYLRAKFSDFLNHDSAYYLYVETKNLAHMKYYNEKCLVYIGSSLSISRSNQLLRNITDFDDFCNFMEFGKENKPHYRANDVTDEYYFHILDFWITEKKVEINKKHIDFIHKLIKLENIKDVFYHNKLELLGKYFSQEEILECTMNEVD